MVWKYRFSFADYQWIPNRKVRDLRQKYCTFHTTPVFQSEEKSLPLPSILSNVVLPKIKSTNGEDDEGFVRIWAGDAGCGCAAN